MQPIIYKESDLPIKQFEELGLASDGKILLNSDNLNAVLSGGRTELLKLKNLQLDGEVIQEIEAKISVSKSETGELEVRYHPVYKEAVRHDRLLKNETLDLVNGVVDNLVQEAAMPDGKKRTMLFEFDKQTKEIIATDISGIVVPHAVNNQELTAAQKEAYRKGKEVELLDGTAFRFAAAEAATIRSNRIALIVSVLFDGGISYIMYQGLKSLTGNKHTENSAYDFSEGYKKAVEDYELQKNGQKPIGLDDNLELHLEQRKDRGLKR